jgi:hypothetical protein
MIKRLSHRQTARDRFWRRTLAAAATMAAALSGLALGTAPAAASQFFFSTGSVTNQIATASRPGPSSGINQETESADDFILSTGTRITSASFTGLLPAGVSLNGISNVVAEIYRVFPKDSNTARTPQVPTRVNSPSDVAFVSRDSAALGELSFTPTVLSSSFTANNSVDTGIHPSPNQKTGGEGPITGQEVRFDVTLTKPFDLPADHYFFVPQVQLSDPNQHFLWLSASRPIDGTGTPFTPDLQAWIRNAQLAPDWLRIGTDVVGEGTFNSAFTLNGNISPVPLPGTLALLGMGLFGFGLLHRSIRHISV